MASLNGFNASEVEPARGFDPLPAGKYLGAIVDSQMKSTSAGTGEYLNLQFEILDGEFKNRKLFHNLNLDNPNETAVQIARAELSAICRAVGVLAPKDSAELHNLPMTLKVGVEKRKDTGEMQNRIKAFEPKDGQPPAATAAKPAAGGPAPWQKKVG
jgi:hypothetical protein